MASFTQRIANLQQVGPVIEVFLTPSAPFIQAMGISPSAVKAIKILAMIDTGATGTVLMKITKKIEVSHDLIVKDLVC